MLIATAVIIGLIIPTSFNNRSEALVNQILPTESLPVIPSISQIKLAISDIVIKYGLDYEQFEYTIEHESTFNPLADNGISVGLAQFTLPTWLGNCSSTDERLNWHKSLDCMGKLWSIGQQYRWDAYCFHYYDEKCIKYRGLYPIK